MNMLNGGMWPVMLTPFSEDKKVDFEKLKTLTSFYVEAGSKGLFANCLSSEMFYLTEEERLKVTQTVVDTVNGVIPVVATGTFSADVNENATFFEKIYSTGIAAVVINSNQLANQTDNDTVFKNKLINLLENTGEIPLGIYECPVPYKRIISLDVMKWMTESKRFLYFKDTSCDIPSIKEKLKITNGSALGIYNANIPTGLESLKMGGRGISPIGANFFPELYSYLADNYNNESKTKEIEKINSVLCVIDPLIHNIYPFAAKWVLRERGFNINTMTRTPISEIVSQDYIKLKQLITVLNSLMKEIGIRSII